MAADDTQTFATERSERGLENGDGIWPDKDVIEAMGRAAGLLVPFVGIAYAAGLIITNTDLWARYRVVSFGLNRAHYVVVGSVWILLTALFAQSIAQVALHLRPRRWTRCPPRIWRRLRFVVAGLLTSSGLQLTLSLASRSGSILNNSVRSIIVVLPVAIFVWVATEIASRIRKSRVVPSPSDRGNRFRSVADLFPYLIISLLIYVWTYAGILYPKLSSFFGGPDNSTAVLVLQIPPSSLQWKPEQVLSPIKVHGIVTETVRIVWFDSDYVAIAPLSDTGKAILLNRSLVSSIRYQ